MPRSPQVLLEKVRRHPHNTKRTELIKLLEAYGFEYRRTTGAHYFYKRPGIRTISVPRHGKNVHSFIVREVIAYCESIDESNQD